jgi:hypothetical protein
MPGGSDGVILRVRSLPIFYREKGKDPIVSIRLRRLKWFAINGDDRNAFFTSGFGDQLLEPGTEVVYLR